jgi:hypothetical protein
VQAVGRDVLYEIAATRIADFPAHGRSPTASVISRASRRPTRSSSISTSTRRTAIPVAIRAERSGDAGWTSSPEQFARGKLSDVVSELSRLQASDILAESMGEKELEKLGLSPPNAIITVLGAPPAGEKSADAGRQEQSERRGRTRKRRAASPLPPAAPRLAEIHLGNVTPKGRRCAGGRRSDRLPQSTLETAERLP